MKADNTGQNIKRTLLVMRTIASFRGEWFSVTQLAEKTGLAKSTAHRFLAVFCEENLLEQEEMFQKYRYKKG